MNLIPKLRSANILKSGTFELKSGQTTDIYFDFKVLSSYPQFISSLSYELSKLITDPDVCVAGVPIGGMIYAIIISQIKNQPLVIIRDCQKKYGTCQQIEGQTFDKPLVLIEDVITTGSSVLSTLEILKASNIPVKQIICILDRENGGFEKIQQAGYNVQSLYKLSDFLNNIERPRQIKINSPIVAKLYEIINTKKTNLIVAMDLNKSQDILDKIQIIGKNICALKIHFDIIQDFSDEFIEKLNIIKNQHNFVVIEDRKLADIPYIALKQIEKIKQFADIITVHGVCGEKLVEELNKTSLGILLIHQLSVENNLIDNIYSNRVKDMADKFPNVVGFVSQEQVLPNYLTFTPGINMTTTTDKQGQTYKTLDQTNSDIFIVGRGVYETSNITESSEFYRSLCYSKWSFK